MMMVAVWLMMMMMIWAVLTGDVERSPSPLSLRVSLLSQDGDMPKVRLTFALR